VSRHDRDPAPQPADTGKAAGAELPTRPGLVVAAVAAALACAALPVFLVGALSERIGDELALSGAGIGAALAAFFLAGAAASVPAGRLADHVGSRWALRAGLAVAAVTCLGIGLTARSGLVLAGCLCLGGTAVAMVDTGGARALAGAVPVARQGVAFGAKEASIPVAALLAGLTLPALGERLGWPTAFLAAAAVAVVVAALVPAGVERTRRSALPTSTGRVAPTRIPPADPAAGPAAATSRPRDAADPAGTVGPPLVALAVAAGLGAAAANAAATFLVRGAADAGASSAAAGLLLSIASAASVAARLSAGVAADRRAGGELRIVVALMSAGAVGLAGLATQVSALLLPAAVLALGAGWGWTGLVFLAAVRLDPARPARAAGIVLAGLAVGGAGGPAGFGAVSTAAGFRSAWTMAAAAMAVAAAVTVAAARQTAQHHDNRDDGPGARAQ